MTFTVRETEIAQGDAIGTLESTLTGTVTWSSSDLPSAVALAADTGALTLAAEQVRAYEAASYTFTATADNGTDTEDVAVTVTVQDFIDYGCPPALLYDFDLKSMAPVNRTEYLQSLVDRLLAYRFQREQMTEARRFQGGPVRQFREHVSRRALQATGIADELRPYLRVGGVEAG